ncbi:hypothetical protein [Halomarina litorea]|uniref:hypothetical protein n=1 Tax=Halomarina litorea TaxID=2961595 RepID=UPI0020C2C92C|nr:hypothetical protein [Halomarina sp. BCD28]
MRDRNSGARAWRKTLSGTFEDIYGFFDIYNQIFVVFSAAVVALVVVYNVSISTAVAVFTALYALIAFNQMRNGGPVQTTGLAVRPAYDSNDAAECDFGLKNLGEGPALYLRAYVRIEDEAEYLLKKMDRPIHLDEEEFVSLTEGDFSNESLDDISAEDDAKLEFYYTFTSPSGIQYPRGKTKPLEMSPKELVEATDEPRSLRLGDVRENCAR